MRVPFPPVLLMFVAMPACAPALSLGSPCVRPSDCPARLTCVASRCREECVAHRDCTLPSRCVVGTDGLGACTLTDDRCDLSSPCPDGLMCDRNACFDPCIGTSCPAEGECSGGLCLRPSGADAGLDAPPADAPPADAPPSPSGRVPCSRDADCGPTGMCGSILGGQFVCRPRCATVGDCAPGATSTGCVYVQSVAGGDATACALPCDLFGPSSGCAAGEACDVVERNTASGVNAIVVECRPVDPVMGRQDASCADGGGGYVVNLCAAGYVCDGVGPGYTCQAICSVGGTVGPACPPTTRCAAFPGSVRFAGATLGSCDPT